MNVNRKIYDDKTCFWIYRTYYDTYKQLDNFNKGYSNKYDSRDVMSDNEKNNDQKHKTNNVLVFRDTPEIACGDIVFFCNVETKGKNKAGFIKHYRLSSYPRKNNKYNDIYDDNDMQKKYCLYDFEYEYEKIFNMIDLKSYCNEDTPIISPHKFNKDYVKGNVFTFTEIPASIGIFILNLITRKIREKKIVEKPIKATAQSKKNIPKKTSETDSEISNKSNKSNKSSETDDEEIEDDEDDEDDEDEFRWNKRKSGEMIPIMIKLCKKMRNKEKMTARKFMDHYANCYNCESINNNCVDLRNILLKKGNTKINIR